MRGVRQNWRRHSAKPFARSRWLHWAHQAMSRYAQLRVFSGSPSMLFARRWALSQVIYRRWTVSGLGFFSRIHLSISPHVFTGQTAAARILSTRMGANQPIETVLTRTQRSATERTVIHHPQLVFATPLQQRAGHGATVFPHSDFTREQVLAMAPLQMVFQRLYGVDNYLRTQSTTISGKIVQNLEHRVLRRTSRWEEPDFTRPTVVMRSPAKPIAELMPRRNESGEAPGPRPETMPVQPQNLAQIPPANMNQLTEHVLRQLDNRLHAWRERMGRS